MLLRAFFGKSVFLLQGFGTNPLKFNIIFLYNLVQSRLFDKWIVKAAISISLLNKGGILQFMKKTYCLNRKTFAKP